MGTLGVSGRGLEFRIPGQKQSFLLSQGAKLEQLKSMLTLPGRELEITGELNWRKSPPLLSVEYLSKRLSHERVSPGSRPKAVIHPKALSQSQPTDE